MFIVLSGRDFFIMLVVFTFLMAIINGSVKLKERVNKKVVSGQFNKKQTIILWVELLIVMSVSIYYAIIGMYNSMGGCNYAEKVNLNDPGAGLLIIFGYMKYAFFISLIIGIICSIPIRLLRTKRTK